MFRISNNTQYIIYDGKNTIVKELDIDYVFTGNVIKNILDTSCMYYGSSLNGRLKGSQSVFKSTYKLPIIISEKSNIIFFPLKDSNTYWINFNNISSFSKKDKGIVVTFKNGYMKYFKVSFTVFNNNMLKCSRLWLVYLSRK